MPDENVFGVVDFPYSQSAFIPTPVRALRNACSCLFSIIRRNILIYNRLYWMTFADFSVNQNLVRCVC